MSDPTTLLWMQHYATALNESDTAKLREAVLAAEASLFIRAQELAGSSDHHEERKDMDAASADLLTIKIHKLGWPAPDVQPPTP
jgi:hypothetical protein